MINKNLYKDWIVPTVVGVVVGFILLIIEYHGFKEQRQINQITPPKLAGEFNSVGSSMSHNYGNGVSLPYNTAISITNSRIDDNPGNGIIVRDK